MNLEVSRLKTRLALIETQIHGHNRMILDRHLWGSRVAVAERARSAALAERLQLIAQIKQFESLAAAPRGRGH